MIVYLLNYYAVIRQNASLICNSILYTQKIMYMYYIHRRLPRFWESLFSPRYYTCNYIKIYGKIDFLQFQQDFLKIKLPVFFISKDFVYKYTKCPQNLNKITTHSKVCCVCLCSFVWSKTKSQPLPFTNTRRWTWTFRSLWVPPTRQYKH